jgi:hypothetical protein
MQPCTKKVGAVASFNIWVFHGLCPSRDKNNMIFDVTTVNSIFGSGILMADYLIVCMHYWGNNSKV